MIRLPPEEEMKQQMLDSRMLKHAERIGRASPGRAPVSPARAPASPPASLARASPGRAPASPGRAPARTPASGRASPSSPQPQYQAPNPTSLQWDFEVEAEFEIQSLKKEIAALKKSIEEASRKAKRLPPTEKLLEDIQDNESSDIYEMADKLVKWARDYQFDNRNHPSGAWRQGGYAQSTDIWHVDKEKLKDWQDKYFPKLQNLYDKLYEEQGRPSDNRKIEELNRKIYIIKKDVKKKTAEKQDEDMQHKERIAKAETNARKHAEANKLRPSIAQLKDIENKYTVNSNIYKMAQELVKWADNRFREEDHPSKAYEFVEGIGGQGYRLNTTTLNNWYNKYGLKNLEDKLKAEKEYNVRGGSRRRRRQNKSITSKKKRKNTQS